MSILNKLAALARLAGEIWRQTWDLTIRETSFQLQARPAPARRSLNRHGS